MAMDTFFNQVVLGKWTLNNQIAAHIYRGTTMN